MADIFISYSSAERQVTEALASDLEAAGYSVWWDTSLVPGDVFQDVIAEKIAASKAAIVIWTKASIKSKWVYSEATRADAQGKLVPLRTADIASADIPMPFGATHAEIVDNRAGVVTALERLGVRPAPKPTPQPVLPPEALPTEADEQRRARMARMKAEEEHWDLIKRSRDAAALRSFVAHYPDGTFAGTARARLAQVEGAGGNRTALIGAGAAVVLAVVGAGGWWALQPGTVQPPPTRVPSQQDKAAEEAGRAPAEAINRADANTRGKAELEPAKPAPVHDCDRLAAPEWVKGEVAGVPFNLIKPETVSACERAVHEYPRELRFWFQLGRSYLKQNENAKAREWYEKAASGGDPRGMTGLGVLYLNGQGVKKDASKAREWFEKAAAAGDARGMTLLGGLFVAGEGGDQDGANALKWYEKAAAAGDAAAIVDIGLLFANGQGVTQDYAKAREWYEKAAIAGEDRGMGNLAALYDAGRGGTQDYAKAREWYEKAAAAGNSFSMNKLASLLDDAYGGPADYHRAANLLLKATRANEEAALASLRSDMLTWKLQTRRELKRELYRLGHYKGPVDDKWNDAARAAFERYLKAQ